MKNDVKTAYKTVSDLHAVAYAELQDVQEAVRTCSDPKELADYSYALREISKFADDIRKIADAVKETAEKIACAICIRDEHVGTIRTEYCVATPKLKMSASLPSKRTEPEAYNRLLEFLGIRDEISDTDCVRLHWPGMVDLITLRTEAGKPLPPGLEMAKTYPVYSLSPMRKLKGVLDGDVRTKEDLPF